MTNNLLVLKKELIDFKKPIFMVAGFNQWANAGNVSSGIPEYLIQNLAPKRLGHILKGDFYLFQLPGTHYAFRPEVKYAEGYEEEYQLRPINDFYYTEIDSKVLVIFIGTEPNQHEDIYASTLLDAAVELQAQRIIMASGVGFEVPFDKERLVGCIYSLKKMKKELDDYALTFSNYDRNATIGMVINHFSKVRNIEYLEMIARTPSYQIDVSLESDKRAVYDILRRIRYMCGITLDLSGLERDSKQQAADFKKAINKLCTEQPEIEAEVNTYLEQIEKNFEEVRFTEATRIPEVFLKGFDEPH